LPDYDRDVQKKITPHYRPEDAYAGVLITALGMLNMGTTTMVDISQVSHSPEHVDANLQALRDAGLRAVYAYWRGIGPAARYPDDIFRILPKYFSSADELITPALAVGLDAENFKTARRAEVRAIVHIRLNAEPLMALGRAGLLREGDEFIHCTHLSADAWRLIKDIGGSTSHSPPLEMAMGHGMPSIQEAINAGLRPSLSCDHCATVGQDMFGLMRTTFNLQRLSVQQRRRDGDADAPNLLSCREVLEFATVAGARCAGLDGKVGSLIPGKDADLIMIRADDLDTWPLNNALSAVVNLMNPGHVEAVFVRGRARKWGGRLVGVDIQNVLQSVKASRDSVLQRADHRIGLVE
jgi:cytosine/adenosine deaminase-related metal-dependent hydrolase